MLYKNSLTAYFELIFINDNHYQLCVISYALKMHKTKHKHLK